LVADIGNTQMVFGLYEGDRLLSRWCLSSSRHLTADELGWQLFGMFKQSGHIASRLDGVMAASVVPHFDMALAEACRNICGKDVAFVGLPEVKTGMAIDYKNPREVGADRIANAVAAREICGSPVIVLDCGTATTFDIVSPEGHYAGGLIVPGMEIALDALSGRAARLPEVSIQRPSELIGRDTVGSMQSGSYWAMVDGLSGIIRRLHGQPGYEKAPVIATGGLVHLILGDISGITSHSADLTLEGLRLLAERHFGA
jgi:type III pantothenate kinase